MTRIYAVLAFLGLLPQPAPVYVRVRQAEIRADLPSLPATR
ncbi:hypothetical protein ACRAWG_11320 [Methylobacterium sp. P31]